ANTFLLLGVVTRTYHLAEMLISAFVHLCRRVRAEPCRRPPSRRRSEILVVLPGLAAERHPPRLFVANSRPAAGAGDGGLDAVMDDAPDPGFLLRDLRRRERP